MISSIPSIRSAMSCVAGQTNQPTLTLQLSPSSSLSSDALAIDTLTSCDCVDGSYEPLRKI